MMELGLTGRTAHVTAASRGIGRAIALGLAKGGAAVTVSSRSADEARAVASALGRADAGWPVDLTKPEEVDRLARALAEPAGPDILVYNTGGPAPGEPDEIEDADWEAALQSLLLGYRTLLNAVVPGMASRGWGRVLLIGSASVRAPLPALFLSNVLRPAAAALTKAYADRYGRWGVTFNVVCPGAIDTDRVRSVLEKRAAKAGTSLDEARAQYLAGVPAGRLGTPEEVAGLAVFLSSQQGAFVNGACLHVDGGGARA
jgi:3-oxoacyl-[acyl-carrier protein] reductase